MARPSTKPPSNKIVVTLRADLAENVRDLSTAMNQNPSQFVNLCVEGCIQAMKDSGSYSIPIVDMNRKLTGKTFLTSKAVMNLVSVIAPDVREMDRNISEIWMNLVNNHDGPLTNDILKSYYRVATDMNKERIAQEKRIAKIKESAKS